MSNTIKHFDFQIIKMKKGDLLPFNPFVQIVLDYWSTDGDGDVPLVSPRLMTESEIDSHIQQLKLNLDAVAKRAKAALVRAQDGSLAIAGKKSN